MSTPVDSAFNVETISSRAAAYGIPGYTIDGNDFLEVFHCVHAAAGRARNGDGPTLVEALTYRIKGHSRSDRQAYRSRDEVRRWQEPDRDPILRFASTLIHAGLLDEGEIAALKARANSRVDDAVAYAEAAPKPDPSRLLDHVYA
ncbi:MAG: thiamine pyrophosphate-dependent enzyme [Anaerolineaceae bacterium]|nr:thiamine pyrophosphate-dependent enzyme [Anaerolineaceae bacterium]